MNFFSYRRQHELKLLLGGHHPRSLISQVFQRSCDVNFLSSFGHPAENHVYEAVGARPAGAIAAMDHDGAGSSSVGLVDFSPELQEGLGGRRNAGFWPGEEVELGDCAGLACTCVLQIEGAYEVVIAPDVFAD